MRVLLVGAKWHGELTEFCKKALEKNGVESKTFYYWPFFPHVPIVNKLENRVPYLFNFLDNHGTEAVNRELLTASLSYKPDVILILKGEKILGETLKKIKAKLSCVIASWWFDDPFSKILDDCQNNIISCFQWIDYFFIFDSFYFQKLKNFKKDNLFYLPLAFDPSVYRRINLNSKDYKKYKSDVSFVGSRSLVRETLLNEIVHYDLNLWGANWDHKILKSKVKIPRAITPETVSKIYNASKINLNINESQSVLSTNARTFEVLGAGGFLLTDYRTGLDSLFSVGEELIAYKDMEQFKSLVHYYLNHDDERKAHAELGYKRVQGEHTYENRIKQLLDTVGVF